MDKIKSQKELLEENESLKSKIASLQKSNFKLKEYAKLIEESEKQFKAFANQTTEGVTVADLDGNYVYVNPGFCKMSGYSEEELLDLTVFDMKSKKESHERFAESKNEKEGTPMYVQLQKKDRTNYFAEIIGNIITVGNEKLVLGTIRDITSRKLAEEKIKSNEKRYRSIFEATPIALWEEDFSEVKILLDTLKKKGVKHFKKYFDEHPEFVKECADLAIVIDVNKEAVLLHEALSKEDLLDNITNFFTPESFEAFKKQLVSLITGKNKCEVETVVKTKSGNIKQVHLRFVVAPGYEADFKKVYISIQDISSLKKTQLNLIKNQDKLNEVLSIANLGSFVFYDNTDLFETSVIGDEILGIDKLYKRNVEGWANLIHPEDFMGVQQFIDDIGVKNEAIEFRVIRPIDKKVVWLIANIRKEYDEGGVRIKITGTFRDFTERKLMIKTISDSENMLIETQQVAKMGSYILNFETGMWKSSLELDMIFGIKSKKRKGVVSWLNVIHPDDKEMMIKYLETNVMLNHEFFNKEYRIINKKTKETHWVYGMGALVFDDKGNLLKMKGIIQDITEAKTIREAFREKNELLRNLSAQIPGVIYQFLLRPDGTSCFPYSSIGIKDIYGLTPEQVVESAELVFEMIHPDDLERVGESIQKSADNLSPWRDEYRVILPGNKEPTWIEGYSIPQRLDDGSTLWHGLITNIDQRKKAEEKIKFLSEITQQAKSAVLTTNLDFEITWINESFKKLYEYTLEEVQGKSPIMFNADFLSEEIQTEIYDTISVGNKYKTEILNKKKDGTVFPCELQVFPIRDERNTIIAYSSHMTDITERKEKEKELKDSKKIAQENEIRYKALHNASFGGIAVHDKGVILDCNQGLSDITGYTFDELIGMDGLLLIEESFRELVMENILAGYEKPYKAVGVRKNKELYPLRLEGKEVPYKGKKVRSVEFRDITERKKIESELIKSKDKAEESNRLKTEFLHNMSHEIRTPMNGILGFTQLLDDAYLTDKKRTHFVNIIQNSGRELLHIIDDILEISKLETKQVSVVESEVCINDSFFELFSIFDIKAKEQGISLYFKKGLLDAESTIYTDKVKLNKILSNLLENALKFTTRGYVAFGYSLKKNNTLLEIYVKDTGIGIEPEKQKIIFERFSQAEKKISRKAGGLGLGLSIAKENAELLDGEISVESKTTDGATFTVTIPYKPVVKKNTAKKRGGSLKKEIPKCTILIAEDEEVNFLFLEILLIDKLRVPCKILHAIDGVEAVEMCKDNPGIDLVLMDIKMPKMNGYDATIEIKKISPDLPIVAQTAYSTREDMKKAKDAGCDEFITKPINKDVLNKIIGKYLRKNG